MHAPNSEPVALTLTAFLPPCCQLQIAFTRALSNQLVSKNIRVNAVAPGPIWTPLIPATFPKVSLLYLVSGGLVS
jgi:hypothetical protein